MTDLKERFSAAALDEPPFTTRVSDAVRRGRFEQRRRLAVGWVSGVAVVAVAVSAAGSLHSPGSRGSLSVPGGGSATSTSTSTGPATSSSTELPPTSSGTGPRYEDAAVNAIFAARQAQASRIVEAVRAHLEQAGYTVQTVSADLSADHLMEPHTAVGAYTIRAGVSKGTDFWTLDVAADNVGNYKVPDLVCVATDQACTVQALTGGGHLLTAAGVAEVFAANRDLRTAAVGRVSGDAANAGRMSRSVLVSIVKDPALDLSDVPRLNAAQLAVVQADWAARHESATPPAGG